MFVIGIFTLTIGWKRLEEFLLIYSTFIGVILGILWAAIVYMFVFVIHIFITQRQVEKWS